MNIASYVTVDDLKEIDLHTAKVADDNIIAKMCLEASRQWESMCRGMYFYPIRETRYYPQPVSGDNLKVDADLLAVEALTADGDAIASTDFYLASGTDFNRLPADTVRLRRTAGELYFTDEPDGIAVDGWWGNVPNWGDGDFIDTGVDLDSITTVTTFNVDSLGGDDELGLTVPIRRLDLIRLIEAGVTEYCFVTATDSATPDITVIRAVNGTTQVSPTMPMRIYVWRPTTDIMHHVRRLAAWYYRQKDTSRPDTERPIITTGGVVLPSGIPKEIIIAASRYHSTVR